MREALAALAEVQLSLKEHIEKQSPVLGRNAQYEKSSSIASLPPFLVVWSLEIRVEQMYGSHIRMPRFNLPALATKVPTNGLALVLPR